MSKWMPRKLGFSILSLLTATSSAYANTDFEQCKTQLSQQAVEQGVKEETAKAVFANIQYQPRVISLDRSQPFCTNLSGLLQQTRYGMAHRQRPGNVR